MNNNGYVSRRLRGTVLFLVLCLLLQGGLYLLFSEPYAAWFCSAAGRLTAERVELDDEGLLEYHALRGPVTGARLLVVGCDGAAAGTAELLLDLLSFIKRCTNVREVVIDLPEYEVEQLNAYLGGEGYYPTDVLRGCNGVTAETLRLVEGIETLNTLLPPIKRLSFRSSELTWTLGGNAGEPLLYVADRSLGAAPLGDIDHMLKYREGVVTLDVRYQACTACAEDTIALPVAGEPGNVWLIDYAKLEQPTAFYRFVVTRTRGGRLADLADAMEEERGDYALVLVGADAAEPLE